MRGDAQGRIDQLKGQPRHVQPRRHPLAPRGEPRMGAHTGGDGGVGGHVARAAQVLQQRGAHQRLDHHAGQGGDHRAASKNAFAAASRTASARSSVISVETAVAAAWGKSVR